MAKDYADIICEAVDEIVSQRLKDISFDTTIECIIYDASEADQGKYICSNGSAKFIAYSENTKYKKDDAVLVSIPQGDYNKQKTIISKQVTDSTQSINFQRPFDTIVDATSNLIKGDQGTSFLRANQNYNNTLTEQDVTLLEIWSRTFEEPLCGYTRLGLQAQFMTWLKSFKCREGNYGLMARIVANSAETAINDKNEIAEHLLNNLNQFFIQDELLDEEALKEKLKEVLSSYNLTSVLNYQYIIKLYKNKCLNYINTTDIDLKAKLKIELKELLIQQVYNLILDCKDMFGDIYNFETYSEQEKVFDITGLDISNITLYFYESNNFYAINSATGQKVAIPSIDKFGMNLPPNLFVKDPYICVGLSLDSFTGDSTTLYTVDGLEYNKILTDEENTKNIQLRWIHYYEDENKYSVINKESELDFDIRWYRYKIGAPSADQYSGVYWERTNLGITKTETRTEIVTEEVELEDINNLTTYYLLYHYQPGTTTSANQGTYITNFKPEYKVNKNFNADQPLQNAYNYSHMSYWTDECLDKYNIPYDLAQKAFVGNETSSIVKYANQSWEDIYKQGFVFHDKQYNDKNYKDYYMQESFPAPSGCMHKVGFWEKFTLAYRLYWVYPDLFPLLLGNKDVWKMGGNSATGIFDSFGSWDDYAGKNPYSDFGYNGNNLSLEGTNFKVNANSVAYRKLLNLFADSFGAWEYIEDEYGMKDYVPSDLAVRNSLTESLELFFNKLDNPTYTREYEHEYEVFIPPDHFQYNFIPDTNLAEELIKVIILHDDQVIKSNILRFSHDGQVVDKTTVDNLSALGIICEDGSYGNYYIYSLGNELIDKSAKDEIRFFKCVLDSKEYLDEASDLTDAEQITWYFPVNNTMIYPYLYNWSVEDPINNIVEVPTNYKEVFNIYYTSDFKISDTETGYYLYKTNDTFPNPLYYEDKSLKSIILYNANTSQLEITHFGNKAQNDYHKIPTNKANYVIKNYYSLASSNNTVQCQIVKDRVIYTATKQLFFGLSGTSGTDVTLTINFNNNETALTIKADENGYATLENACILNAKLYNQQGGMPIDLHNISNSNNGAGFTFDWDWFCAETTRNEKKYKQKTDFYPVIFTDTDISDDGSDFYASTIHTNIATLLDETDNKYKLTSDYYYYDRVQQKFIACEDNEEYKATNIYYQKKTGDVINYHILEGHNAITQENYQPSTYFILYEGRYLLDDYFGYNEVLTYYEPLRDAYDYTTPYLEIVPNGSEVEIKVNSALEEGEKLSDEAIMDSVFILRLTLTGWGDYPLVAYKPIALRRNEIVQDEDGNTTEIKYESITGDTCVIYNSAGEGISCKEPYKLWRYPKIAGQEIAENGSWQVYVPHYFSDSELELMNKHNFVATMSSNNILQPPRVYIANAPQYSIQFETLGGKVVWTQPILTIQNNYPSAMLNNWNGKDITTDNDTGIIMASAISAGKKESDNTFSGVVIGDWSRSDADASIKSQTGVYGFHHGSMSYALKEDGTAFFGKAGKGRIYLDGNKSQIYSSNWLNPNRTAPQGLLMDLDDGYLKMQNGGGLSVVAMTATEYTKAKYKIFKRINYLLRAEDGNTTIYLDKDGNEFFPDKYTNLNASTDSLTSMTLGTYFESNLDKYYYPKTYASKSVTQTNFIPNKYYIYAPIETVGEDGQVTSTYDYRLVPSQIDGIKSNNTNYSNLLDEFNNDKTSFFSSYTFYIPSTFTSVDTKYSNNESAIKYESHMYYSYYNAYKLVNTAKEAYDPEATYYINSDAQYITLSSVLSNQWPLAIGTSLMEGQRNFRVSWDGTLYSTNGHFTGEINATSGTLGDLDVNGTLNGGSIYGAYIDGAEIEGGSISSGDAFISDGIISGATIKGSTIYFGQSKGYQYEVVDSNGNHIRNRVYANAIDGTSKIGDSVNIGNLKYTLINIESDLQIGTLRQAEGDDQIGKTSGVELAATSEDYFLRLSAPGRILVKSTGGAASDAWVAMNAGTGWDYSQGGGHIQINSDGSVIINATSIKFETDEPNKQDGIYARFAPDPEDPNT